jgi:phosphatidylserine/phosphatidylglycerophosphate/cardiolipin synthase-like enzyme
MVYTGSRQRLFVSAVLACLLVAVWMTPTAAQLSATPAAPTCAGAGECLCDSSYEDCRSPILQLINSETVGIDVSFWFMTDQRYSAALIRRWQNGVRIRVIVDTQADVTYAGTQAVRDTLVNAGIPIRNYNGPGINHWKMMLFAGQQKVEFSAANYADGSYSPSPLTAAYTNYVDEAIYFTDDPNIVHSFMKRYDDNWVDTTTYVDFANITTPLTREYPAFTTFTVWPELNFVPDQHFENRLVPQVRAENLQADAVIFRITSAKIPDELIKRFLAGTPVRVITEEQQYRNPDKMWHAYNVDRMYAAGIPIKVKDNTTDQDVHQKSIVLYSRGLATSVANRTPMVVFGSSNWTTSSSTTQQEHNYFTTKPWMVDWFKQQFERKWNNLKVDGTPIGKQVYVPFTPLPPDAPIYASPVNDALGLGSSVTLKWEGGWWAHKYDVYLDTTPSFTTPIIADYMPSFATSGVMSAKESYAVTGLLPGTAYYWKIVSKTMANRTKTGPTWHFTTAGTVPPPPAPSGLTASFVSRTRIDLQWNDVAGEDGYKIERRLSTDTVWTQIATTAPDVASYVDTNSGLRTDTTYNYRVRAFTTGGNSGYSNILTVKTLAIALSQGDVVLYAAKAPVRVGAWTPVADATAAGGQRLENFNAGASTLTKPVSNPTIYFEMTFHASAGVPYRLWMRGKAYNDSQYNDSVYVQFSDSVDAGGTTSLYQTGTLSATQVNLEDCAGCFLKAWGWQDNGQGAGVMGPAIYFANSGVHTIRVQPREDGVSLDQIVLSPDTFLNESPGALKIDTTILPEQDIGPPDTQPPSVAITQPGEGETVAGIVTVTSDAIDDVALARVELWVDGALARTATAPPYTFSWDTRPLANDAHSIEARAYDTSGNSASSGVRGVTVSNPVSLSTDVILYASEAPVIVGAWTVVADATAAGGARIYQPNAGAAKITTPSADPANYFELTFNAEAGIGYRLWLRGRADADNFANDSVHVQFSDSVSGPDPATQTPTFRIGSTTSTEVNLEDCSGCGLSGWGWQDNGWGVGVLGPEIFFATSGTHTIRIQAREDGFSIDQIVLSPSRFISSAPGALKNDSTIVPR